eukprot:TRINITY_DN36878_c0_g1_i1.p1 TRINITY_DN36878_c0_g1~~TRINITY_DN36878_c0_g1_i1.p1  ORF type:complete len:1111 (+),score=146.41 TRINITY_DN36878_c0_g1_i1:66-3398(+)
MAGSVAEEAAQISAENSFSGAECAPGDAASHATSDIDYDGLVRMDSNEFCDMAHELESRVDSAARPGKRQRRREVGAPDMSARQTSQLVTSVLEWQSSRESIDEGSRSVDDASKKGWFAGVFVPTCENMWGVLMFLRFHFIVGHAGLAQTLCVVILCFFSALCTTSSVSSIAFSGGLVSRGGPYYMISRALGPVVGGTIGIMYWLAITMLSVLECIGAAEALALAVPELDFPWGMQLSGSCLMAALVVAVWGGINAVTRLGLLFALVVTYTIFSLYLGLIMAPFTETARANPWISGLSFQTLRENWHPHYGTASSFGVVLGLFYPCYTGILSGADRADTLRDPPKNIRLGTYAAVCFSLLLYASLFVLWASVADHRYLQGLSAELSGRQLSGAKQEGSNIASDIFWNPFPSAALLGIIIASLSQALQCLVVAPRLLQAVAQDQVLSLLAPLATLSRHGEPVRALFCTYVFAALLVLIGDLDLMAPLLTMCFLVTYAFVNLSCCALTWLKPPAWRPPWIHQRRWRIWSLITSITGFGLCVSIMFLVNIVWAIVALFVGTCLHLIVNWALRDYEWGSAFDGIKYQCALSCLMQLEKHQSQRVNWRPRVLILYRVNVAGELKGIKHREILQFYSQFRKSKSFCVVACVLESPIRNGHVMRIAEIEKGVIKTIMKEEGIDGFVEVVVAPSWAEGTTYIIQLTGIGGIVPNTVLLDWPHGWRKRPQEARDFCAIIGTALGAKKAVLAIKGLREMPTDVASGTIDIWWMIHDGGFLLLLSWLLTRHRIWRQCQLRVFTVAENVSAESCSAAAEHLSQVLQSRRLFDVGVEVILADDEMIEPYTLERSPPRVQERRRDGRDDVQRRTHRGPLSSGEDIPLENAELFQLPICSSTSAASSGGRLSVRRDHSTSWGKTMSRGARTRVSDCRVEARMAPNGRPSGAPQGHELPQNTESAAAPMEAERLAPTQNEDYDAAAERACSVTPRVSFSESTRWGDAATTEHFDVKASSDSNAAVGSGSAAFECGDAATRGSEAAGERTSRSGGPIYQQEWCCRLNMILSSRSAEAQLVVINIPDIWGTTQDELLAFMSYCDTITSGLHRVLFVHSAGDELFDIGS